MKKIIIGIVIIILLFIQLIVLESVFASTNQTEIGETENGEKIYVQNQQKTRASGDTGSKVTWDHDPGYGYGTGIITIEGVGYVYCIQPYVQFPTGNNYDGGKAYNNQGVLAILTYGFPKDYENVRSKYSFSDSQAYVKTFVAINAYLGNYNRTTVENAKDPYVNYLLKKGDQAYVPTDQFKINAPKDLNSSYNQTLDRKETNEYTITGGSAKVSNLPSGVEVELTDGKIVTNGGEIKAGQGFKFIAKTEFDGDVSPVFTGSIPKRVGVVYSSPGTQSLVVSKLENSQVTSQTTINFKKEYLETTLIVTKYGEDSELLLGVSFDASTSADFSDNVSSYTTDENGQIIISTEVLQGESLTYYLRETETLASYVLDSEVKEYLIKSGEVVSVEIINELIKSKVVIHKVDVDTNEQLSDAVLVVEKLDQTSNSWVEYSRFTTTTSPQVFEALSYGTYRLSEVRAPESYQLSEVLVEFEVTTNNELIELTFENTKILTQSGASEQTFIVGGLFTFLAIVRKFLK